MPFVKKLQQTYSFLSIDGLLLIYKFFFFCNPWVFCPLNPQSASHHCLSAPFLFSMHPKYLKLPFFSKLPQPLLQPWEIFCFQEWQRNRTQSPSFLLLSFYRRQALGMFRPQEFVAVHFGEISRAAKLQTQGLCRVAESTCCYCVWAVGPSSWLVPRCHPHMTLESWPKVLSPGNSSWHLW